jgi:hypothetical protein
MADILEFKKKKPQSARPRRIRLQLNTVTAWLLIVAAAAVMTIIEQLRH